MRVPYLPPLTSGYSKWFLLERIFSNNHDLHDKYDKEWGKKKIKKHIKFQTWHAIWSSGIHIYPQLTSGSSGWLIFERIFSNNHEIHDRYKKEWKNERSRGILNFKRDMLCEVQGSIFPSFDFRILQISCIWKTILKSSWPYW